MLRKSISPNTIDFKGQIGIRDILFSFLCYIPFLWVFALLVKDESEFVYYHLRQGIVLFFINILFGFFLIIPKAGIIFTAIGLFLTGIIAIINIYWVCKKKMVKIPLLSKIALNLNF